MRYLLILCFFIGLNACNATNKEKSFSFNDNPVVAHRGAWKLMNLPQNSIASLKQAIALNCTGSEFDVQMTADKVLVINHDADYNGMLIEETTYAELAAHKLSNGETIPTLREYLLAGMENNPGTGLVCEIKPSNIEGGDAERAVKVLEAVKELNAEPYILSYISFSYEILEKINEIDNSVKTQFLGGSKSPEQLKEDGISGLDYHHLKFRKSPEWIESAKDKGLILNAWTVNKAEDIDWLLSNNFDYITTDQPELVFERIEERSSK